MDIKIVVGKLIMLATIMSIGYIMKKINILNNTYNKGFSTFILNISMPCLVIDSILSTTADISNADIIRLMLIAFAIYTSLSISALFISKIFLPTKNQDGVYKFLLIFNNNMFMGFPIILSVLDEEAAFYCAIFNIVNTIFMFSVGTYFMKKHTNSEKISIKKFLNPGIISSVICTILYFLGYTTPLIFTDAIKQLGNITIPLSMIVLGVSLADIPARQVITDIKIYILIIIKMIIIPILMYFLLSKIIYNTSILYMIIIILSMPGATLSVSMATEYDGDIMLASKYVFLSTILSMISVPFVINFII